VGYSPRPKLCLSLEFEVLIYLLYLHHISGSCKIVGIGCCGGDTPGTFGCINRILIWFKNEDLYIQEISFELTEMKYPKPEKHIIPTSMPVLLALLFFNYSGQHKQNKKRVTKHG
jgi:hypothetical protein